MRIYTIHRHNIYIETYVFSRTPPRYTGPPIPAEGAGSTEVCIEGWTLAYQGIWDLVQKKYPATAPRSFGNRWRSNLGPILQSCGWLI